MKIVSWNCGWKYWTGIKHSEIIEYEPDILGISECNAKEKLPPQAAKDCIHWAGQPGTMRIKGVAAFLLKQGLDCKLADGKYFTENNPVKYSIPLCVTTDSLKFNLLFYRKCDLTKWQAQWDFYADFITQQSTIIIGDFNCPSTDRDARNLTESLARYGLVHVQPAARDECDHEIAATFYPHNNKVNLIIDYSFASKELMSKLNLRIGSKEKWIDTGLSDHCPLILDIAE